MSLVIALGTLIILTVFETSYFKVEVFETVPTNLCGICLILHLLAFFNKLYMIDLICVLIMLGLLIGHFLLKQKRGKDFGILHLDGIVDSFNNRTLIVLVVTIVFVCFFMRNRYIAGWDDFKFWAAQVKSLFYQNGYGKPHTNICNYFGDYPMGNLLMEYWFERLGGESFRESLLYIGQMIFSIGFLVPIIKKMPSNIISVIVSIILLISFGSAFTRFGIGLEPDRTMAFAYGAALVSVLNMKSHPDKFFYRIQFGLILGVICLQKSIGFLWAIFALIFYLVFFKIDKQKLGVIEARRLKLKLGGVFATIIVVITGSWNIYCNVYNRSTYLTQEMANSFGMPFSDQVQHIKDHIYIIPLFLKIIFLKEMNCSSFYPELKWNGLNLSPFAFILFAYILCFLMSKNNVDGVKTVWRFSVVVNLLYALILLWSYLFMFYRELSPERLAHLQNMTSHYYEPAICGMIMCVYGVALQNRNSLNIKHWSSSNHNFFMIGFITLLLVNIPMVFVFSFNNNFVKSYYEVPVEQRKKYSAEIKDMVEQIKKVDDPNNARVVICQKQSSGSDDTFRFCLLHYEVSPISTVDYIGELNMETLSDLIGKNHCGYAYIANSYSDTEELFYDFFGDDFKFDTLIKLEGRKFEHAR